MKPYLRDEIPKIPDVPSYDAGYLVTKNASWRSEKPVVCSEKCTGCLQCYLYCPDGVISKDKENNKVKIDYDYCKGLKDFQKWLQTVTLSQNSYMLNQSTPHFHVP